MTLCWKYEAPPKRRNISNRLHGATLQSSLQSPLWKCQIWPARRTVSVCSVVFIKNHGQSPWHTHSLYKPPTTQSSWNDFQNTALRFVIITQYFYCSLIATGEYVRPFYLENKVRFRLHRSFHWMDFHETSHLALSTYPLQNDLNSDPPII